MGSGASAQRKAQLKSVLADFYTRAAEDVARSEHTEAVVPNASAPPESSPSAADEAERARLIAALSAAGEAAAEKPAEPGGPACREESQGPMPKVLVKTVKGDSFELEIDMKETVANLKKKVCLVLVQYEIVISR